MNISRYVEKKFWNEPTNNKKYALHFCISHNQFSFKNLKILPTYYLKMDLTGDFTEILVLEIEKIDIQSTTYLIIKSVVRQTITKSDVFTTYINWNSVVRILITKSVIITKYVVDCTLTNSLWDWYITTVKMSVNIEILSLQKDLWLSTFKDWKLLDVMPWFNWPDVLSDWYRKWSMSN